MAEPQESSNRKNVFVIGLDTFNRQELETIHHAERYRFHSLLDEADVLHVVDYPVEEMLEKARRQLRTFDGSIDAIIGYWDFPVTMMVPLLCREWGLRSASLESVLRCEHKYWSRVEQRKAIPECTPRFDKVDPFDEHALERITLDYPFWVKPVKSFGSQLGFKVEGPRDFTEAMKEAREHIGKIGRPFNKLLELGGVRLPEEMAGVDGMHMIAEELISGVELAPEGYVFEGEARVHGIMDMVREKETFSRYEYPSTMPEPIRQRTVRATKKLIRHIGYDNACFNIEFFWDEPRDRIWVVEVNPRISQSHSNLFEKVNGVSNHEVAVDVALGRSPRFDRPRGRFRHAAKCMLRRYEGGIVRRVPSDAEIEEIGRRVHAAKIRVNVEEGTRLSELGDQDAYSYDLADIIVGGETQQEMLENYDRVVRALEFRFDPEPREKQAPTA